MRVGFVGLGRMGRPMAARLLAAGFDLRVFDARRESAEALTARHGGTVAGSLAEVGRESDAVITMLPDGPTVHRVVAGDGDRLLDGLRPGATVIDMSSSAPVGTVALGRLLAERGIGMLDAPVSGGVARAEAGTLAAMVGGEPALVERWRPLLGSMAASIFATGPLGSGHAVKALNNLVSAAGLVAAAEALLVGRRFGVDPEVMLDVFNASTARNNSTEQKFRPFVFSRTFASGFALDLMVKDLGTAVDLAAATNTPVQLGTACRDLWAAAQTALGAGADHTEVVRWLEGVAGVTLGDNVSGRWQGWRSFAPRANSSGTGPWIELSHPLRTDLPRIPFFPAPRFERIMSMPRDPLNVTEIQMVCHFGTHVDAPCHFIPDAPAFHEIPLDRLYGPGVVWRIAAEPYGVIDLDDLARAKPALREGDIVLLDTGWAAGFGTTRYDANPSLNEAAAAWLVERGAKLVGVDFATPDLAVDRRPPGFAWPVHHVLLGAGVLIAEHLTNLRPLAGRRVEAMFLALNIEGADGAPARVVARPLD